MFRIQYRITRDSYYSFMWAIESRRWWWPFWIEQVGMLNTKDEAISVINDLRTIR